MLGESANHDFKSDFDPTDQGALLNVTKHLVAMANSGGGTITFGANETARFGISSNVVPQLDGAKISDLVNKYVRPRRAEVSHRHEPVESGRVVVEVTIASSRKYPLIFSRQGNYGTELNPVFREGQYYVRHGAKTEIANYEDYVQLVDKAVSDNRGEFLSRISTLVNLPEGTELTIAAPDGDGSITPATLIDLKLAQRRENVGAVLDAKELLWCFVNRGSYELTPERLDLLIRSALRRTATLYFWLAEVGDDRMIVDVLFSSLEDTDRDKSDAKTSIPEIAAQVADDSQLESILAEMSLSKYSHFREGAENFPGRFEAIRRIDERIEITSKAVPSLGIGLTTAYTRCRVPMSQIGLHRRNI